MVPGDSEGLLWRYIDTRGEFVFGKVKLEDNDIFFEEVDDPLMKSWPVDSLPATIVNSEDARAFAEDKDFATDLYGALCSTGWTMKSSGKEYVGTWTNAGEIAAETRNKGDIAADYFMSGNEGYVTTKVGDLLGSLGWVPGVLNETPEDRHKKALKLLQVSEGRQPATEVPAWYVHWISGYDEGDSPIARMHRAAFAGKVSYTDWCRFWELVSVDD